MCPAPPHICKEGRKVNVKKKTKRERVRDMIPETLPSIIKIKGRTNKGSGGAPTAPVASRERIKTQCRTQLNAVETISEQGSEVFLHVEFVAVCLPKSVETKHARFRGQLQSVGCSRNFSYHHDNPPTPPPKRIKLSTLPAKTQEVPQSTRTARCPPTQERPSHPPQQGAAA